jgi:hypothetical protein
MRFFRNWNAFLSHDTATTGPSDRIAIQPPRMGRIVGAEHGEVEAAHGMIEVAGTADIRDDRATTIVPLRVVGLP